MIINNKLDINNELNKEIDDKNIKLDEFKIELQQNNKTYINDLKRKDNQLKQTIIEKELMKNEQTKKEENY